MIPLLVAILAVAALVAVHLRQARAPDAPRVTCGMYHGVRVCVAMRRHTRLPARRRSGSC